MVAELKRMNQVMVTDAFSEPHYTVTELAKRWHLSPRTVRSWFEDEPGVLKHGHFGVRGKRRPYVTLRIAESVARRVYAERSKGWRMGA